MKTSELQGAALDWAVAKAEGKDGDCEVHAGNLLYGRVTSGFYHYSPSTDWSQGGPIIEREEIAICPGYQWEASMDIEVHGEADCVICHGPTPLIAAMRCYVASKLGDEIEIPEELK